MLLRFPRQVVEGVSPSGDPGAVSARTRFPRLILALRDLPGALRRGRTYVKEG